MKKLLAVATLLVLSASLGVAALLASSAPSAPSFAPAKSYATGRLPDSVAIGDLNGDGKPDLATASHGAANTVSVLINKGNGSFRARRTYRTGVASPYSVAIGDLNVDGKPDLVTGGGSVSVLFGSGDGSFQSRRNYPIITGGSQSIAIGDFNGDQKPDLAVAPGAFQNQVSVFLNTGDGTLGPGVGYTTTANGDSVVVGDVNGDGSLDLVTTSSEPGGYLALYLNRGDGTFDDETDPPSPDGTLLAVAIGDLNGDGKLDLAASANMNNAWEGGPTISVYLNRGDARFRVKTYYVQSEVSSLAIGDLNGDGKQDLATTSPTEEVSVFVNTGQGRFQPHVDYRTRGPAAAGFVALGDLNGDGKPDLAATSYPNAVSVLVNRPGLCTVQYVVGRRLRIARQQIVRANCRVGRIRRAYSRVKRGRVISQKPRFGAVLPRGSTVNLVVSRGWQHS